jgi:NDP-sugar pyrophosphorylase family protein
MPLQCIILAGGLGTRMRPYTDTRPKCLIPVLGRAFVDWQLELVASRGVERVVYSVGYRGEMVRNHIGDGSRFGLKVAWVDEGTQLRGTGGALRLGVDQGALDDAFFVLNGDSYLPIDMEAVAQSWYSSRAPALMTVMRNEGQWDASNVIYSSGRVRLYDKARPVERRAEMHWIDFGLSVLTRDAIATRIEPATVADMADLMRELSIEGRLAGHEVRQRFFEVGSPQGLRDLERLFRDSGVPT